MSVEMVDHIVDEHNIEIESDTIKRVKVRKFVRLINHEFLFFPFAVKTFKCLV